MKAVMLGLLFIVVSLPVVAGKYGYDRSDRDVTVRPPYSYDPTQRYRGEIDKYGDVNVRNPYTGERLRGTVDRHGDGYLRDSNGNRYRIRQK